MKLTKTQRPIMPLLAADLNSKQIGAVLGISHQTVRDHLTRMYAANKVHGPIGLVLKWVEEEGGKPRRVSAKRREELNAGAW